MKWLFLPAVLALAVGVGGCKPNYPNCNSDSDCPGNAQGKEWCVNGQCQQCRPEPEGKNDCGPGKQCKAGRCEAIPGYCAKNSDCPSGVCEKNRCAACKDDTQCPGGGRCQAGRCEADSRKACKTSDECAETEDCVNGRCTPANRNRYVPEGGCQLEPVYFGFNEFELAGAATAAVDKNAECIKKNGRGVNLVGHTDSRGTPEYNLALSDKRAQAVKRRLVALGVDGSKLVPVPRGELDATGSDESSMERDRRVESNWR
jgi:peptidoglycan-associated lipoprotein